LISIARRSLKASTTPSIQPSCSREKPCGSRQETSGPRNRELPESRPGRPVAVLPVSVCLTLLLLCDLVIWAEERGVRAQMPGESARAGHRYAEVQPAPGNHA
jgi:hypothetical protein